MTDRNNINNIKISGFRRLKDIDLRIASRPFMVLIGANGVGKTSFLDAISLLSASARGELNTIITTFGGLASVITREKSDSLTLFADIDVPGHKPLCYELSLTPIGPGYSICREELSQARDGFAQPFKHIDSRHGDIRYYETASKRLLRPNWVHNPLETSLYQVPKMYQQPEELRRILGSVTQYHFLDVGPHAKVKLPQKMTPAYLPGAYGEDLVPFLYYLRESDSDGYEALEDVLKSAFPNFERLSFPPVAAGMLTMTWKDRNFSKPFAMHELSEGTLRFLWLVSLLHSPDLATFTMIDEPEVSLHPELLSILIELMRESAERTQLIVATHSDSFVRFLEPKEIVVMDIDEDGCATMTWGDDDKLDLEKWLDEYSLDEIWRMGQMGGRS